MSVIDMTLVTAIHDLIGDQLGYEMEDALWYAAHDIYDHLVEEFYIDGNSS